MTIPHVASEAHAIGAVSVGKSLSRYERIRAALPVPVGHRLNEADRTVLTLCQVDPEDCQYSQKRNGTDQSPSGQTANHPPFPHDVPNVRIAEPNCAGKRPRTPSCRHGCSQMASEP